MGSDPAVRPPAAQVEPDSVKGRQERVALHAGPLTAPSSPTDSPRMAHAADSGLVDQDPVWSPGARPQLAQARQAGLAEARSVLERQPQEVDHHVGGRIGQEVGHRVHGRPGRCRPDLPRAGSPSSSPQRRSARTGRRVGQSFQRAADERRLPAARGPGDQEVRPIGRGVDKPDAAFHARAVLEVVDEATTALMGRCASSSQPSSTSCWRRPGPGASPAAVDPAQSR